MPVVLFIRSLILRLTMVIRNLVSRVLGNVFDSADVELVFKWSSKGSVQLAVLNDDVV